MRERDTEAIVAANGRVRSSLCHDALIAVETFYTEDAYLEKGQPVTHNYANATYN